MRKLIAYLSQHQRWFIFFSLIAFSFLIAVLMNISWGDLPSDIEVGQIARHDIRADKEYEITDEEATDKQKKEAIAEVLPVFDWDDRSDKEKIVESLEVLDRWRNKGIIIRPTNHPELSRVVFKDLSSILSLDQARSRVQKISKKNHVKANLFFNEDETKLAQEEAFSKVKPTVIHIRGGESIVRMGDPFEPWHLKVIHGIRKEKAQSVSRTRLIGSFFFVSLFLFIFYFVLRKTNPKLKLSGKDFLFLGSLLLILVVLERVLLFVSGAVRDLLPWDIPLSAFYGLVPVAAGVMMVRLALPLSIALVYVPLSVIIAGILLPGGYDEILLYLMGSVVAIPLMSYVRSRGQILTVGLQVGIVNALTLLALEMLNIISLPRPLVIQEVALHMGFGLLGGLISASMVLILMPVFESLFNYVTPIKLLEYGSLNHPLLREMIVRAPGTYHHSHMVGTLAEAASEAIGADSLFARVASYFHDIGKMKKSSYFIENQPIGEDRHGALSPSMSALIIASHVKDGMELAKEYKLPQRIIDIIPQHQGTKLISYFYNKAKEEENPEVHVIDERHFRYPGPKPQTREAGIILLADTTEAATRALKDRSPARLEEVVRNMINENFIDGQLDECELTLKDLHTIANSFVRILMGIYHQRIEYPPDAIEKEKSGAEGNGDKYSQSKPIGEDSLREASQESSKNIRRLGPHRS